MGVVWPGNGKHDVCERTLAATSDKWFLMNHRFENCSTIQYMEI